MFDLKITGGTIVDGTGAERLRRRRRHHRRRDRRREPRPARRRGHRDHRRHRPHRHARLRRHPLALRRPGVLRRRASSPSTGHGVTTVVLGVCGIGFAPARPDAHEMLIQTMESVEDIPGDVLRAGLPWDWETFPEFLDALDRRTLRRWTSPPTSATSPLRTYVMGEKALENGPPPRPRSPRWARLVARGHRGRRASASPPPACSATPPAPATRVPGTFATEDELFGHRRRAWPDRPPRRCSSWPRPAPTARTPRPRSRRSTGCVASRPSSACRCRSSLLQATPRRTSGASCSTPRGGRGRRCPAAPADRQPSVRHAARPAHPSPLHRSVATFQRVQAETNSLEELVARAPRARGARRDPRRRGARSRPATRSRPWASSPPSCRIWRSRWPRSPTTSRRPPTRSQPAPRPPASRRTRSSTTSCSSSTAKPSSCIPFFNYAEGSHDAIYEMLNHPAAVLGLGRRRRPPRHDLRRLDAHLPADATG